jgi:hypothetical protein
VRRCTAEDQGEYVVRAVNSYGERDYNVFLTVDPAPKAPEPAVAEDTTRQRRLAQEVDFDLWKEPDAKATFTFKLRPRLIQVGINCKLLCCVSGKPAPKVHWSKNGVTISDNDPKYSIEYGCNVCTLEIGSCTLADSGQYKCFAENPLGSDETACSVQVEELRYDKPKALLKEQGGDLGRESVAKFGKKDVVVDKKTDNKKDVIVLDTVKL